MKKACGNSGIQSRNTGLILDLRIGKRFTSWSIRSQPSGNTENGVTDRTLLDPATWILDQVGLDRPGNRKIQMDLFLSYGINVPLYPEFQAFFRKYQPPTLIVWGKNDFIFPPEGAAPYSRDLKNVETHLLDTGHFALETHGQEIASRIEKFLSEQKLKC
jgi:pimeloyl-ACP methyl ester carboxylesterase